MKTYGQLTLTGEGRQREWVFRCAPHVMMRLKSALPRLDKGQMGMARLKCTPETCVEVEWFCSRFPLEMAPAVRREMERGAEGQEQKLAGLETMLRPGFTPRVFPLAKPLRDYQARGVEVLSATEGLLLGDELGLGKTVTAIGAFTLPESLPALVVCPTHLPRQWQENFLALFLPSARVHIIKGTKPYALPPAEVLLISYSKLQGWGDVLCEWGVKTLVFDEIQELRHAGTGKYRAAMAIRLCSGRCIGLSATPIYNYGGEIYNILEITSPGRIGAREEFYREWCTFKGNDRWLIKDPVTFGEYLRDQFLMLRRRREEVGLELPKVERSVLTVPHDAEVLRELESSATELARLVLKGSFTESGQAARELDAAMRQATGVAKAPFVADFVRMLVESGERVLLFGWHREVYDIWLERLRDLNPVMYTGSETPAQKAETLRQFLYGEAQVLIMSLRSGTGVDGIQKRCRTVVHGELDWSPAVHEQGTGRLNRDGLLGGVLSYYLVSEAGSDPVVASVLGLKQSQAQGVVDPDKAGDVVELQGDTGRVKRLAKDWLRSRGIEVGEEGSSEN